MSACTIALLDSGWISLSSWRQATPWRPFWRFYWAADAGAWIAHAGERFDLGPGAALAIAPIVRHRACRR